MLVAVVADVCLFSVLLLVVCCVSMCVVRCCVLFGISWLLFDVAGVRCALFVV